MFDFNIRLQLAQGVLLGEKDAHQVLGDLLEESGEPGLAQWARAEKVGVFRRLDFVLAILPYRYTLCLGCDFMAAASTSFGVARHVNPILKRVRDWSLNLNQNSDETLNCDLATAVKKAGALPYSIQLSSVSDGLMAVEDCIALFENAIAWAEQTIEAEKESDVSAQRHGAKETVNHIRRMRRFIPGYISGVNYFGPNRHRANQESWWVLSEYNEADFNPGLIEFPHWEIQHTLRWISKMLESSNMNV